MHFTPALVSLLAIPVLATAYLTPGQEAHQFARRAAVDAYYEALYTRDLDFKNDYSIYVRDAEAEAEAWGGEDDELTLSTGELDEMLLGKRDASYLKCQSCKKNTTKMSSVRCPSCGKGPLTKITKSGSLKGRDLALEEPVGAWVGG